MTWFKVDDSLPDHPKMLLLQAEKGWQSALALWTLAGAWASKHLTDGSVPDAIVARLGCTARDAALLVKTGFWERVNGGFQFHKWHARNPTREAVESKREKTRNRVSEWRRNGVTPSGSNTAGNASPVPSRPVPGAPGARSREEQAPIQVLLEQAIGERYRQHGRQAQSATDAQLLEGARRVANAVSEGFFADAEAAAQALASAAVAEALKPKGKLGFALHDVEFAAQRKPNGQLVRLPGYANADAEWNARNPSRHVDEQTDFK